MFEKAKEVSDMSPPQLARIAPPAQPDIEPEQPFLTDCHRNALERLRLAYKALSPLSIVIGEGKSGASFVISRFLNDIAADDIAVARVTEPCADPVMAMRRIIRAIGFEPKDMNLADLEKIFTMFLSYQRTHHCRTIICIEEAQDNSCWMLDKIRRLVEMEAAGKYGLMVILTGQPGLNQLLSEPPLNAIRGQTRDRIYLSPLTETESREYVKRRVEAGGQRHVGQVFDFEAVGLLHEISGGVPDVLSDMCSKCLELLDDDQTPLVTPEVVAMAEDQLRQDSQPEKPKGALPLAKVQAARQMPVRAAHGHITARIDDEVVQKRSLDKGHILIGRDVMCDICINHPTVSRYHALIVNAPRAVRIVDLGSTNGTFVNGRRFRQFAIKDNDSISVGVCKLQFHAGGSAESTDIDTGRTDHFEPHGDGQLEDLGTELLRELSSLAAKPASTTRH